MNQKKRLIKTLKLEEIDRIPVAQPLQTGTVDLMEKTGIYWPNAHKNPKKMAKLSYAAHELIGFESVRVPYDMSVLCESLGCELEYNRMDSQPVIKSSAINDLEEINGLKPISEEQNRKKVVTDSVRYLKNKTNDLPIIAAFSGPFVVAGQTRGMEDFLKEALLNEKGIKDLLEITLEACIDYAQMLEEAGVDVITILGSSSDLISPKIYEKYCLPNLSKLIESIKAPTILHTCGNTKPILEDMIETGADGISIESSVDIGYLKEIAEGKAAAIGNIDVINTLLNGTPEEVKNESRECIEKGVDVLTSGCGIPPNTPSQNLKAMVETVKN